MGKDHHHHHQHEHHHHHHHHHGHGSCADHDLKDAKASVKRIWWAFTLNMAFALIELVGGIMTGSFAIIADAVHDFGDGVSLGVALILQKKSGQGPSEALTYGYLRYSVLSSLLTGVIIIAGSFVIIIEAISHLMTRMSTPNAPGMIGLSILGIIVNGLAALGLSGGHSHNEKILSWHLLEDLLGWTAVLIGAIVIYFFNITWLDPVLAIGIALFVLWNVARNLRGPLRIVLQYVPSEDDLAQLRQSISQLDGFHSIDQLHAWSLDGRQHVLTAHIRVKDKSLALPLKKKATALIEAKGFRYVTLDVEPSDQV